MQEKLAITIILISLALFALIFVLYRIVNENSERYNKIVLSQRQQEYASRTIPYRRGDIVDRNGTYLATSEKVYNLILDPSQIMDKPDYYLEPTIQALVDVFGFDGRICAIKMAVSFLMTRKRNLNRLRKREMLLTEKAMMTISQDFALPAYGLRMNTEGSIHMVPLPAM